MEDLEKDINKESVDETTGKQHGGVTGKGFMPGVSGNLMGRPKGSISFTTEIKQYLEKNPKKFKELMQFYLTNEKMRELLWKMIDGMPKQRVGIKGEVVNKVRLTDEQLEKLIQRARKELDSGEGGGGQPA